jgi:2-polyprenyl-3-methyl-5-hydroxy-6-metoxy-1,4-benzoquinol methylase
MDGRGSREVPTTKEREGYSVPASAAPVETRMVELQERVYDDRYDYAGDPHLAHPELRSWIVDLVSAVTQRVASRDLPLRVLEIGAGDGGLTESLLARGYEVTATDVSRRAIERLEGAYGGNPNFKALYDPAGDAAVAKGRFSVVVCASVLHHMPDYVAFVEKVIDRHLSSGGGFVSVQDPLRYDTMSPLAHRFDRAAYLIWRLRRGDRLSGLISLKNRLTGRLNPSRPGDMVEYHVVRNGVDENALRDTLEESFEELRLVPYWSNQSRLGQRLGRRFGLVNQFALVAEDHTDSEIADPPAQLGFPRASATWPSAVRVAPAARSQVDCST